MSHEGIKLKVLVHGEIEQTKFTSLYEKSKNDSVRITPNQRVKSVTELHTESFQVKSFILLYHQHSRVRYLFKSHTKVSIIIPR